MNRLGHIAVSFVGRQNAVAYLNSAVFSRPLKAHITHIFPTIFERHFPRCIPDPVFRLAAAARKHLSVSGAPAELEGVRQLIYEVAYNLGDNAIKYNIDGGSVSINVSSDGKNAKLTVSDTGIGIAAEDQSRIFERFYRVDKSHSKESGGTGLGLSIVKHAVQYHGGRISMDSAPGKGTSISVSLPIQ